MRPFVYEQDTRSEGAFVEPEEQLELMDDVLSVSVGAGRQVSLPPRGQLSRQTSLQQPSQVLANRSRSEGSRQNARQTPSQRLPTR